MNLQTFTRVVSLAPFFCCMVATGGQHSVVLQQDGTMWTFGSGERGELGHGRYESSNSPQQVPGDFCGEGELIEMVAAGGAHSACITSAGVLWTWGSGVAGQLGVRCEWGKRMDRCTPHHVTMPASVGTELENQVLSISCGGFHSLILKRNGSLWGCGRNTDFAIEPRSMTGHPQHLDYVFTPLALGANFADTKFASVYATFSASSAVDVQGRVWHWGNGLMAGAGGPNEGGILIRKLTKRIGRCHELQHEHALAICMASVQRLSMRDDEQLCRMRDVFDKENVLRHLVFPMCNQWPRGSAGLRLRGMPGLLRLLGGFLVRHAFT
jgi:alpha-tubulin suppressor-like RCC1 family protein